MSYCGGIRILVCTLAFFQVQSHTCVLKERPNPSRGGNLTWSLALNEICLCKGVVAPKLLRRCSRWDKSYQDEDIWFVDDPRLRLNTKLYKEADLDVLLKRTAYCGSSNTGEEMSTTDDPISTKAPAIMSSNEGTTEVLDVMTTNERYAVEASDVIKTTVSNDQDGSASRGHLMTSIAGSAGTTEDHITTTKVPEVMTSKGSITTEIPGVISTSDSLTTEATSCNVIKSKDEATNCTSGWDVIDRPSVDTDGWIFASPDAKFDCDGILTEWRFQSKTSNPFKVIVWRHVKLTQYSVVGINTIAGGYPADQEVVYTVPDNERISVRAGDVIGWAFPIDAIVLQYTDTLGGTQVLYKVNMTEPLLQDRLADDQVVDINFGGPLRDYSIEATVSGTNCSAGWLIQDRLAVDGGNRLAVSPQSQFSCNGILTQWRYQSKLPEPFKALVFRPMSSVGPTIYTLIGINDIPSGAINEEVVYMVPKSDQICVKAGDVIGWSYPPAVQAALQFTITPAPSDLVDTLIQFLFYETNWLTHDQLQLNSLYNVSSDEYYREYSIMATVSASTRN